ncbi:fimbrial protein [Salmonella enterica]|uniref:F4 (K88) fimbria minor subunit FaeF n=1 Tax=Salmonella oranienberg TaxID=28147 RepID=A0A730HS55_SALON|nr:fimbrial protein [Salmonella enterica]ECC8857920.1 fimbrial protein [Salmonella enterica subsp. enterica]ECS6612856.1 fimbrial protein [Salmonella enterica subsp. enterica serovar Give]EDR1013913.1 F4 (K88) fimbria minor subunit FaeF [Salmonella enterica subsp. enterica serovar Glostrup]EEB7849998.1 F4 (K88) fimbria minor subunit FaeF [Salmonella enterica subsp. enterica serovar Agona]EEC0670506.1 F4 (K88) fimbria minor subunit FaeF [Salmonella enterica subsp. enterica serovar Abaetetuba]E
MKKTMMAAAMVLSALSIQFALAAEYSEKTQYLGVVNGQVSGNSVVKVTRTPTDPVLYRNGDTMPLPDSLIIRNAESRAASGGLAYITVKQALPDNGEARITLKTALTVDGKKVALSPRQQGEDVVIPVPEAQKQVELRTDAPAELEVPVSYRGNLQIALQVED